MASSPETVSTCRFCAFYDIEGRRGGQCQKLSVPVRGFWRACPLARSPFTTPLPLPQDQVIKLAESSQTLPIKTSLLFSDRDLEETLLPDQE